MDQRKRKQVRGRSQLRLPTAQHCISVGEAAFLLIVIYGQGTKLFIFKVVLNWNQLVLRIQETLMKLLFFNLKQGICDIKGSL